ncbi:MAG: surface lipoprotein assembly modifier [Thiovulaceae bacterium]|jgi:hypothetical protein|nr:surface lipoprotein assembly modifier [Sulfurimonadaceae bacterium]MDD3817758.1 surface lipoprotein assembly modifier [Sulfurimonadaceae bacterium]
MKRYFALLLGGIALLQADMGELQKLYEEQRYEEALLHAKSLKNKYADSELHLLWAKSAEALGNDDEAMSAYERVVILDPSNDEAKQNLYGLYKKTGREALASEIALELGIAQDAQDTLGMLHLKADVAVGYDTNVNMSATTDELNQYFGGLHKGEESTLFTRISGGMSYKHNLERGWFAQAEGNLLHQGNLDAHLYDMFYASVGAGFGYETELYRIYVPLFVERLHYLDTDLYNQIKFEPRVSFALAQNLYANFNFLYTNRNYLASQYETMEYKSYGFGGGLVGVFDENFVYATIQYEDFHPSKNIPSAYVDKRNITSVIGARYSFLQPLALSGEYRLKKGYYKDSSDLFAWSSVAKREDTMHQVDIKLSYAIEENFSVYAAQKYIENNSNYRVANYDKSVSMFGMNIRY